MFALPPMPPHKSPHQGQLEELPVMPQNCGMNHCCPFLAERVLECILWGTCFPEALIWHLQSLHDLVQSSKCTRPAASMPAHPALHFLKGCKVSMFTIFAVLVLVPPCQAYKVEQKVCSNIFQTEVLEAFGQTEFTSQL